MKWKCTNWFKSSDLADKGWLKPSICLDPP
jgi:hypothetical protein